MAQTRDYDASFSPLTRRSQSLGIPMQHSYLHHYSPGTKTPDAMPSDEDIIDFVLPVNTNRKVEGKKCEAWDSPSVKSSDIDAKGERVLTLPEFVRREATKFAKDPRDVLKRERGQRRKPREKKRVNKKFDSTLGYPGEGPRRHPSVPRACSEVCPVHWHYRNKGNSGAAKPQQKAGAAARIQKKEALKHTVECKRGVDCDEPSHVHRPGDKKRNELARRAVLLAEEPPAFDPYIEPAPQYHDLYDGLPALEEVEEQPESNESEEVEEEPESDESDVTTSSDEEGDDLNLPAEAERYSPEESENDDEAPLNLDPLEDLLLVPVRRPVERNLVERVVDAAGAAVVRGVAGAAGVAVAGPVGGVFAAALADVVLDGLPRRDPEVHRREEKGPPAPLPDEPATPLAITASIQMSAEVRPVYFRGIAAQQKVYWFFTSALSMPLDDDVFTFAREEHIGAADPLVGRYLPTYRRTGAPQDFLQRFFPCLATGSLGTVDGNISTDSSILRALDLTQFEYHLVYLTVVSAIVGHRDVYTLMPYGRDGAPNRFIMATLKRVALGLWPTDTYARLWSGESAKIMEYSILRAGNIVMARSMRAAQAEPRVRVVAGFQ